MNWPSWLLSGFVATLALSTLLSASQGLGLTRMNLPYLIGTFVTSKREKARFYGFMIHMANGLAFSILYVLIFQARNMVNWWFGLLLGLGQAMFVLTVGMALMPGIHPRMASEQHGTERRSTARTSRVHGVALWSSNSCLGFHCARGVWGHYWIAVSSREVALGPTWKGASCEIILDMQNRLSRSFSPRSFFTRPFFPRLRSETKLIYIVAAVLSLTACLRSQSTLALPRAPGAEIFELTPEAGSFTEPSIAVNPGNPQQVVAVFQDNAHASYSQDAGRSWKSARGVAPPNYRVSGDVSTTFDNHGHAFICYIAFDRLGTFNYWGHGATRNGILVRRSLDGGATWEANDIPVAEQPTKPGVPFEDKPYIVSDTSSSRYAGNLYVGWTRWSLTDSKILFSRSTDDGKTWSPAIEIDRTPGLPRDDNGANEGFDGAVGPDGRLYAIWSQGDDIFLTTSRDGGKTFSRVAANHSYCPDHVRR